MNSVSAVSALSLSDITRAFLHQPQHGRWTRSDCIWYEGTNRRRLGTLPRARRWLRVANVPLPGPHAVLTPNERRDVQNAVRGLLGLDFKIRAMIDRDNATVLRVEIRLHERVTRSLAALNAFFDRSARQDEIAKGATPAFAFVLPAEFDDQPG